MDIRQLEAFVYTVKYQSFSLAAQKLYLSQPTVSSHINNLEKEQEFVGHARRADPLQLRS